METFTKHLTRAFAVLAALSTVILMVAIAIDVVSRNFFGKSVPGMIELSETSLVFAVFLGLAVAGANNEHVKITLLTDRLTPQVARVIRTLAWTLSLIFLLYLVYTTGVRAFEATMSGESRMGLLAWPVWPSRWALPIGLLALALVAGVNVWRLIHRRGVMGRDEIDRAVQESAEQLEPESGLPHESQPNEVTLERSIR